MTSISVLIYQPIVSFHFNTSLSLNTTFFEFVVNCSNLLFIYSGHQDMILLIAYSKHVSVSAFEVIEVDASFNCIIQLTKALVI